MPDSAYPGMISIPCSIMRGGSSKGAIFLEQNLPSDPGLRKATLLASYGSPDARQIDGIGGADPLTSKAVVVGRSTRNDADLDYTFYQVGIDAPQVSMGGTCGNMLAAVGPFALMQGLIAPPAGRGVVAARVHATNTGQVFMVRFESEGAFPLVDGEVSTSGVPGTSSAVRIDFGNCAGSVSGRLLPTGNVRDALQVRGRSIEVSLVDAATPFVFVRASDLGANGDELPVQLAAKDEVMTGLESIRGWAAQVLGLAASAGEAAKVTPNVPRIVMVAPPSSYATLNGTKIDAKDMDVCTRQLAMQRPHKALAVTGSICTAVASRIPGSIVQQYTSATGDVVRLGHPSGVTNVRCMVDAPGPGEYVIRAAEIDRSARLLMHGNLMVRKSHIDHLQKVLA